MKQRARKHLILAKLGHMDTVISVRTPTEAYDPYTGRCYPVRTQRIIMKQGRRVACWRAAK